MQKFITGLNGGLNSMNAIMSAVNYSDLLIITLPYNRHNFDRVLVVTDTKCEKEVKYICEPLNSEVYVTDSFYYKGASFAKWRALEEALDVCDYRYGWLCLMDADVLWPKNLGIREGYGQILIGEPTDSWHFRIHPGQLCSPLRRMWLQCPNNPFPIRYTDMMLGGIRVPGEEHWKEFPIHRNVNEWAGYTQIFNCADPVLGDAPWHQIDWKHAGGADSFFQNKWPKDRKIRPTFEVLHLGTAGVNWFGRSSEYMDNTLPEDRQQKHQAYMDIWPQRRQRQREGLDPFEPEKIK